MLRTALLAISLSVFASGAFAIEAPKYDRKIEAAVKKIVAEKVGGIRGGFDFNGGPAADVTVDIVAAPTVAPEEKPMVQVAFAEVPAQPVYRTPAKYHSGRPEPIRKVRKVNSFQYF